MKLNSKIVGLDNIRKWFFPKEHNSIKSPPLLKENRKNYIDWGFEILDGEIISQLERSFNSLQYVSTNEDVRESGSDAFTHYFLFGWKEGRRVFLNGIDSERLDQLACDNENSCVLISSHRQLLDEYLSKQQNMNLSEYQFLIRLYQNNIDYDFYTQQTGYSIPNEIVADHYLIVGKKKGLKPNACFREADYLDLYSDVDSGDIDPFYHFCAAGKNEGRLPNKLNSLKDYQILPYETIAFLTNGFLDVEYYLSENEDVRSSGIDPVQHYALVGWKEARSANGSKDYLFSHEEINSNFIDIGVNPALIQYVVKEYGLEIEKEEDLPIYKKAIRSSVVYSNEIKFQIEKLKPHIDEVYYFTCYPDVAESGLSAVEHYCLYGWKEYKDPSPDFSTSFYLNDNPDVVDINLNPFYHYIVAGVNERRYPKQPGGAKAKRIWAIQDLETVKDIWRIDGLEASSSLELLSSEVSHKMIETPLILSFSHDVYTSNIGGVQACVRREQLAANQSGLTYVHLSPAQPLPYLSSTKDDFDLEILNLVVDGEELGSFTYSDIKSILSRSKQKIISVIHVLQGHSPELIQNLINSMVNVKSIYLWLHDNFTLCPNYTLQRNDVDFCYAPSVDSQVCSICVYGGERKLHLKRIQTLLSNLPELKVLSPSDYTKGLWVEKGDFSYSEVTVVPHLSLKKEQIRIKSGTDINVAFVGFPAPHKGWSDYLQIYYQLIHTNLNFYHVASGQHTNSILPFIQIGDSNTADVLRNNDIDYVIVPSHIPETFNLVCHEAMSAGANILCFNESGNISHAVEAYGQGYVFNSVLEMIEFLQSIRSVDDVSVSSLHSMQYSSVTMEVEK
jgi:hypothetical protein